MEAGPQPAAGGTVISYNPLGGQRWQWILTSTLTRPATNNGTAGGYSVGQWSFQKVPGQDTNPWQYCLDTSCFGTTTVPTGTLVNGSSDTNAFEQSIAGYVQWNGATTDPNTGKSWYDAFGISYHGCGPQCHFGFTQNASGKQCSGDSPCANWTYWSPIFATLTMTMSTYASNPITVSFSGQSTGTIDVTSNAAVTIDGQITNPNGNTTISAAGPISVGPSGQISSQNLTLISAGGIGQPQTLPLARLATGQSLDGLGPLPVTIDNGGVLSVADSSSAGVYINLPNGATISQITAGSSGAYGDVQINAQGSVVPQLATSQITGKNIAINTTTGTIGSIGIPFQISANTILAPNNAPIPNTGVVNATAPGDIGLTQLAGNLEVGAIASTGGNVLLNAPNGSILDASGQTAAQVLDSTQIKAIWASLGLENASGAVSQFTREVVNYYNQYWGLLRDGQVVGGVYQLSSSSVPVYTPQTAAALNLASPSSADGHGLRGVPVHRDRRLLQQPPDACVRAPERQDRDRLRRSAPRLQRAAARFRLADQLRLHDVQSELLLHAQLGRERCADERCSVDGGPAQIRGRPDRARGIERDTCWRRQPERHRP
jgi:hypothetical protein